MRDPGLIRLVPSGNDRAIVAAALSGLAPEPASSCFRGPELGTRGQP